MPLTVKVWKVKPNYKAFAISMLIVFAIMILGSILASIESVFLLIALLCFALIPISAFSIFVFGKCEKVTANVLSEVEISTWVEVKRFWWILAILFFFYVTVAILSKRYYYVLYCAWIIAFILLGRMQRLKIKITDLGLVFGRSLLLSWDDVENVEILNDKIVLKGRWLAFAVPRGSIPKEILNNLAPTKYHVYS